MGSQQSQINKQFQRIEQQLDHIDHINKLRRIENIEQRLKQLEMDKRTGSIVCK